MNNLANYSKVKEKAPIYTMGSAEPRSFSRGKRGIAGSLIFTVFDRDALLDGVKDQAMIQRIGDDSLAIGLGGEKGSEPVSIDQWDAAMMKMSDGNLGQGNNTESLSNMGEAVTNSIATKASKAYYDDEIPPFDITISFANEYGQRAVLVIFGVEILNEGTGFSIDNVTTEKACTFVARRVQHMKPVTGDSQTSTGNSNDSQKQG